MTIFIRWITLFSILNICDYISTIKAVNLGAVEVNSLANFFLGEGLLLPYKLIGIFILTFILYRISKRSLKDMKITLTILKFGCALYSFVVLNNCYVYLTQLSYLS